MKGTDLALGIGSWTYSWAVGPAQGPRPEQPLTAIGLLKKARELDVDLVQFADNMPLHELTHAELSTIRRTAEDFEIAIEVGTRGVEPDLLSKYLEIARFLRAKLVRTLIAKPGEKPDPAAAEASLRRILPHFEAAGVSIAIENYEAMTSVDLAGLVRRIGSPNLGICLDTVNSLGALETPAQVVAELAPYVFNLHVKDFDVVRTPNMTGFSVVGRPAGSGRLDVPWLLRRLGEAGRRPTVVLELWVPFSDDLERTIETEHRWAVTSIRYLRTLSGLGRRGESTSA